MSRWDCTISHATPIVQASGLIDADGYLWRDVTSVRRALHPTQSRRNGAPRSNVRSLLGPTSPISTRAWFRIGARMGCDRFIALEIEYRIPVLIPKTLGAYAPNNLSRVSTSLHSHRSWTLPERPGCRSSMPSSRQDFSRPVSRPIDDRSLIGGASDDPVFCAFHPNTPGEVEVIEPETSHVRTDEYSLFS
jgi:chitin disaccharide deacetylase